jgi:hypothetical protein
MIDHHLLLDPNERELLILARWRAGAEEQIFQKGHSFKSVQDAPKTLKHIK